MAKRYNEFHSCVALNTWWLFFARLNKLHEGLLFHIPNQSPGGIKYRANNKRMGVRAGTPDYFLSVPRKNFHGLYIEMKAADGKLSDSQKETQISLAQQGYLVTTCYSTDEARRIIEQYIKS